MHVFFNELFHVHYCDWVALDDDLICHGIGVNLAVMLMHEFCSSNDHGRWHEDLELVLCGDLCSLQDRHISTLYRFCG